MARILLPLLLFALLLAPLRMFGMSEAAAAPHHGGGHHAASAMPGHHAPAAPGEDAPAAPKADCMTACTAIPPPAGPPGAAQAPVALPLYSAAAAADTGLAPEAEPPPPRFRTF